MAQDPFQELVNAVMYAESRGQRFDPDTGKLLEGPKTRFGTAKGEMQVLDSVMKNPGYGVKPAADDSADERARVGRDLLRMYSNKYGDLDSALAAYNWGPGNTNKWLKAGADPAKLPSETRKYIETVKSRLTAYAGRDPRTMRADSGTVPMPSSPKTTMAQPNKVLMQEVRATETRQPTKVAEKKPVATPAPAQDVRVTPDVLEKLGPNYQAALAAMTLADSREDDDEESIAEQYYAEKEAERERETSYQSRPNALAGLDLTYSSPFGEEAPVQMADGGFVDPYGLSSGPITEDTRRALKNVQVPSAREMWSAMKQVGSEGVSNLESLARGSVAAIPGMVGDIESIFRDDKARKFATTPEVEKQYLPQRMTKPTKEAEGFTEVGTYVPLPVDPTKVVQGAKAAGRALGPTAAKMLEKAAPAAKPMYAVKPRGGVFYPEGSGSKVDEYLDRMVQDLPREAGNIPGKEAKTVADFIRTKGRKYLTTVFGTGEDPLREAILEGRIPLYGKDKEVFRKYMVDAAKTGDPEALQDLEKAYDKSIQLSGGIVKQSDGTYAVGRAREEQARQRMRQQMTKEGVPEELQNEKLDALYTESLGKSFATDAEKMLDALMQQQRAPVSGAEKTVLVAAEKGEPIYDLSSVYPTLDLLSNRAVLQGIASIPVADLERMSFPEAIIRGAQNTRLQRSWDEVIDRAKAGKRVDRQFFDQGVKPFAPVGKEQWVQVTTPEAVRLEGAAMNHSVGDYAKTGSYGHGGLDAFQSGKAQVFSLRNEKGMPSVTVETKFEDGEYTVSQIKGPFNSAPKDADKPAIFQLFDKLNPKSVKRESYSRNANGDTMDDKVTIDWGSEFDSYRNYLNKNTD